MGHHFLAVGIVRDVKVIILWRDHTSIFDRYQAVYASTVSGWSVAVRLVWMHW